MGVEDIKKLREMTSISINECRKALEESRGDFDKALAALRQRGAYVMDKKKDRQVSQGVIDSYIHFGGNLGSIVEINCETDFVARTENFKKFVKDIAMHIAAIGPIYVKREDIPSSELSKIANADEYAKQHCLLEQPYVKDSTITVNDYLKDIVSQTGENVVIKRFSRFVLGE